MNLRPFVLPLALIAVFAAGNSLASDACSLLTQEEIGEIQGEKFQEAKSSVRNSGDLVITQCFYVLPTFAKSVALELTERAPDAKAAHPVRDLWKERIAGGTKEREREEEGEERKRAPRRVLVRRVGEQAFWIRSGPTGALYALAGERWLRLSLGGSLPEAQKIAHARQLTRIAIKRLARQERAH